MSEYNISKQIPWKVNLLTYWRIANDDSSSYSEESDKLNLKELEFIVFIHSVIDSNGKIVDNDLIESIECLSFNKQEIFLSNYENNLQSCFLSNDDVNLTINPYIVYTSENSRALKELSGDNGTSIVYDSDNDINKFKPISQFKLNHVGDSDIKHEDESTSYKWLYNSESPVLKCDYMWTDCSIRNNIRRMDFYLSEYKEPFVQYDYYADNQNAEYYKNYDQRVFFYNENIIDSKPVNISNSYIMGGHDGNILRNLFFRINFKDGFNDKYIKMIGSGNDGIKLSSKQIGQDIHSLIAIASNPFILPNSVFKKGFLNDKEEKINDNTDAFYSFSIYVKDLYPSVLFHSNSSNSMEAIKEDGIERINKEYYNLSYTATNLICTDMNQSAQTGDLYGVKDKKLSDYTNMRKIKLERLDEMRKSNIRNCRVDELSKQKVSRFNVVSMSSQIDKDELKMINSKVSNGLKFSCLSDGAKNYLRNNNVYDIDSDSCRMNDQPNKSDFSYMAENLYKNDFLSKDKKLGRYFVGMSDGDMNYKFYLDTNTVEWYDSYKKDNIKNPFQFFGGKENRFFSSYDKPCILFHGVYKVKILDFDDHEI